MMKKSPTPPSLANRLLISFCKTDYLEDIQGDLEEEFILRLEKSPPFRAKSWYYWQVIKLFRPEIIKKIKTQETIEKETIMFRNYVKIGFRNLLKYKKSTFINVIGLAMGLSAFILIALFVKDELSYDKHHAHAEDIYRVTVKNFNMSGDLSRHWAFASAGHAEKLKEDYSFITHAVRFYPWAFPDLHYGDKKLPNEQVIFADNDVFDIFTFPFLLGDASTAFNDTHSIVLTETSATKIFGNDWKKMDILGETIKLSRPEFEQNFKVTGVMKEMPDQQHFHFEYLAPVWFVEPFFDKTAVSYMGGNYNWLTYVRVAPNTDLSNSKALSDSFFNKYVGKINNVAASNLYELHFQPLTSIHLQSNLEGEIETNGSIQQVIIFSIVGILLLLVACVNYMNLSTSHYTRRLKEVGVRKVIGAHRGSLIRQFLTESTLVILISFPLALLLAYLALPYLNDFMYKKLSLDLSQSFLLLMVFLTLVVVGILAGTYPALFLSRINLVRALKGEQAIRAGKWNFRSWLVTFQYAVTIALIFSLFVIENQMQFIRTSDPGYDREQILTLDVPSTANLDVFKQEILNHPDIESAAYASRIPTGRLADNMGSSIFPNDTAVQTQFRLPYITVDEDFLSTFNIKLIAGEKFSQSQDMAQDSTGYYIVNETAARMLGFINPQDIIGEKLAYGPYNGSTFGIGRIQGVTEDFHFESLHSDITPMVMLKSSDNISSLNIKLNTQNLQAPLAHIENTFADFAPELTANYRFVDELFEEQYYQEQRLSTMITVFTAIAIIIGCLGLIGMVAFVIETKYKEIGIRKVLGASVANISLVIGTRFFLLITIAFVIAIPCTYLVLSDWLNSFVYKTPISLLLILAPFFVAILLTLFAIGYQTLKASLVNPVECLKDE